MDLFTVQPFLKVQVIQERSILKGCIVPYRGDSMEIEGLQAYPLMGISPRGEVEGLQAYRP